jgi:hypothetical protein
MAFSRRVTPQGIPSSLRRFFAAGFPSGVVPSGVVKIFFSQEKRNPNTHSEYQKNRPLNSQHR